MDEFGGGQLEELQAEGMEGGPDGFAGDGQFIAEFTFRCFSLKGFQRGVGGQRIEEIAIEGEADFVVDELVVFRVVRFPVR